MQQQTQFRWKGPPVPRAKPIPQEIWELHREELCRLYQTLTLEALMTSMRVRYQFNPSRRQYVSQFDKWEVHKYKSGRENPPIEPSIRQDHASDPAAHALCTATASVNRTAHTKVAHSLHSVQSSRSSGGAPKPGVPLKKRQKLADFMSTKDPYADLGAEFGDIKMSTHISYSTESKARGILGDGCVHDFGDYNATLEDSWLSEPSPAVKGKERENYAVEIRDHFADHGAAYDRSGHSNVVNFNTGNPSSNTKGKASTAARRTGSIVACSVTPILGFTDNDSAFESSADDSNDGEIAEASGKSGHVEREDRWFDSASWMSSEEDRPSVHVSQHRRIDSSRRIESVSDDELRDMKLAADFFQALSFVEQSFPLYVLILKRMRYIPMKQAGAMQAIIVACVQSAVTEPHLEITRSLLGRALDGQMGTLTEAERFTFRSLLANVNFLLGQADMAVPQLRSAWCSFHSVENLNSFLPREHRSLDFLFYQQVMGHAYNYDHLDSGSESEDQAVLHRKLLRDQCVYRSPGPFELVDDQLQNPCLRLCLKWCIDELDRSTTELRTWRYLLSMWERRPKSSFKLGNSARTVKSNGIHLLRKIALYCSLWQSWQTSRSQFGVQNELIWAEQAELRMGIPASELLMTICSLIIYDVQTDYDRMPRQLALPAWFCARRLSTLSNYVLANKFFESLSWKQNVQVTCGSEGVSFNGMEILRPGKILPLIRLIPWGGIFDMEDAFAGHKAADDIAILYVIELIENNLALLLPEARISASSAPSLPEDSSLESLRIITATMLPTLASSLKSSNLDSLRELRDRIQQSTNDAMHTANITATWSKTSLDFPSISDLSQAMASSLNLAPMREASTSALDVLADVSSTIRNFISISDDSMF